jgi:hypothetical protein
MTPAPKRRWLRFSLRTFFVVVAVFGCWLGWEQYQIRQRATARKWILLNGGVWDSYERKNTDPYNAETWQWLAVDPNISRSHQMSFSRRLLRDTAVLYLSAWQG